MLVKSFFYLIQIFFSIKSTFRIILFIYWLRFYEFYKMF